MAILICLFYIVIILYGDAHGARMANYKLSNLSAKNRKINRKYEKLPCVRLHNNNKYFEF